MDIDLIKNLAEKGLSSYKIAEKVGFCQSYISKILRKFGIKTKPRKIWGNCKLCGNKLKNRQRVYCSNRCQAKERLQTKFKNIKKETSTIVIKKYILERDGNKCSICSLPAEWELKKLTMVMDHIDGNSEHNDPINLRLVCPNCDSQLPTFKGRNRGRGRFSRRERYKLGKSF